MEACRPIVRQICLHIAPVVRRRRLVALPRRCTGAPHPMTSSSTLRYVDQYYVKHFHSYVCILIDSRSLGLRTILLLDMEQF